MCHWVFTFCDFLCKLSNDTPLPVCQHGWLMLIEYIYISIYTLYNWYDSNIITYIHINDMNDINGIYVTAIFSYHFDDFDDY